MGLGVVVRVVIRVAVGVVVGVMVGVAVGGVSLWEWVPGSVGAVQAKHNDA